MYVCLFLVEFNLLSCADWLDFGFDQQIYIDIIKQQLKIYVSDNTESLNSVIYAYSCLL